MLYTQDTIHKYRNKALAASSVPVESLVQTGQQRRGLAARDVEAQGQKVDNIRRSIQVQAQAPGPTDVVSDWFGEVYNQRREMNQSLEDELGFEPIGSGPPRRFRNTNQDDTRPRSRGQVDVPENLREDTRFMNEITRVAQRFGRPVSEFMRVIQGESNFNPTIRNGDSGATGLFQFIPSTASMLGTSTDSIANMTPVQQVQLYEKYLDSFDYDGSNALGIMQAAPAYANRSNGSVIYSVGSRAWEQNPGWRDGEGGAITVRSINRYYERQS